MNKENSENGTFRAAKMLRRVSANDVSELLRQAFQEFEAGQLPETQKICTQALGQDPENFDVHQLMAMSCFHAG